MSLEAKIEELIGALDRNTAAHKGGSGGGAAASTGSGSGRGRPAGSTNATSAHKADDVKAKMLEVKGTLGTPAAKQIIEGSGAKDLADLLTKKKLWDAVMESAEEALGEAGDAGGEADDDI